MPKKYTMRSKEGKLAIIEPKEPLNKYRKYIQYSAVFHSFV